MRSRSKRKGMGRRKRRRKSWRGRIRKKFRLSSILCWHKDPSLDDMEKYL